MTRICLVCDVFHPSEESTSQLFTGLLGALAEDGADFDVVTNRFAGGDTEPAGGAGGPRGVRIHAVGLPIRGRGSLPLRMARYAAFVVAATLRLLWLETDRYWASTNPPFTPIWVAVVALLRRRKFDVIVHDVYPDGLVAVGYLGERSLTARAWKSLNRWAFRRATKIAVLGRDMAEVLRDRYAVPSERLVFFPHWSLFDPAEPLPLAMSRLAHDLDLQGRFVVQYSGNMGLWHDMDSIVEAAALLGDVPQVHFLMIGAGRRRTAARRLAASRGLANITWLDFQPRNDLPDSLACASVSLISQRDGLNGMAVPCKLYGILASGRAVVAAVPEGSEVARVVHEERCGVVVPPHEPAAIADAIRALASDTATVSEMGRNAFAAYREKYSLAVARTRYRKEWAASFDR